MECWVNMVNRKIPPIPQLSKKPYETFTCNEARNLKRAVEPHPVDTPPLWTLLLGLFSLGLWPVATPSVTRVDTSLLWTLFVPP